MADPTTDRPATTSAAAHSDGTHPDGAHPDVAELSYEAARDELIAIVAKLEGGQLGLEDSVQLWDRGEALAAHCSAWLDGAQARLAEAGDAGVVATVRDEG